MYDLNIPEIRTGEPIESADHTMITFEAEAEERPFKCEKCGSLKPHVHDGGYLKQLQDIKYENKQVYISLKIQRYRCPDCRHVTSDHFSFFKKHSPLTNRLRYELVNQYSIEPTKTYASMRDEYSINIKTIKATISSFAEEHKKDLESLAYKETPKTLGIDIASNKHYEYLILTDLEEQRLIDIKKSTDHHTISTYLNTLEPHKCTNILLGYNTPRKYIKYIREAEPETLQKNTHIMIDREKVSYNPPLSNQHWYEKLNIKYCCIYSEPEEIIYNIIKARIQKPFDQYYTFDTFKTLCFIDINGKPENQDCV
ncbi:MAG: transposase family protein, partial [Clostridiales bacterium]|nr:transposase family protein [Clostridiales bacterium]